MIHMSDVMPAHAATHAEHFPIDIEKLSMFDQKSYRTARRFVMDDSGHPSRFPTGSLEDIRIREEAVHLLGVLMQGIPQIAVAREATQEVSFSIACLVRHMQTRGLLAAGSPSPDRIILEMENPTPENGISPTSSRFCFLDTMFRCEYVAAEEYDRNLKPVQSIPNFQEVAALVAAWKTVPVDRIRSSERHKNTVEARFLLAYILRRVCLLSLKQIGLMLGDRDHTTILNSVNQVRMHMEKDVSKALEVFSMCNIADQVGTARSYRFCRFGAHRL